MDYLRVQDGVAVEAWTAPEDMTPNECFVAELAATFHPKGNADIGWTFDGTGFAAPVPVVHPTAPATLTFLQFLALFTSDEQAAIVASVDVKVKLFLLMATGATYVDLSDQKTTDGIAYLVSQKLLTQMRATAILANSAP